MATLTPRLTALDERVLSMVPPTAAIRATHLAALVYRPGRSRAPTTDAEMAELVGILRGLQHLGLLRCGRGGRWRRS